MFSALFPRRNRFSLDCLSGGLPFFHLAPARPPEAPLGYAHVRMHDPPPAGPLSVDCAWLLVDVGRFDCFDKIGFSPVAYWFCPNLPSSLG